MILVFGALSCASPADPSCQVAHNPLTFSDIPDPDVIRVGEDYYMISTTMYFTPGAPIMHSRDLVHWETVNYVFDVLEDDDFYNLRGGKDAYGKGQWAASLRFFGGMWYVLFMAPEQEGKTYVFRSPDIMSRQWEKNVLPRQFHDASMLFDTDGQVYLLWSNGDLTLTRLSGDLLQAAPESEDKVIISSPSEGYGLRAEGSHIYHIGDWYYVLEIDWPEDGIRTETCWRSRSLEGPYESRVVLQGTIDGLDNAGVAQGPIVDTPSGEWYAIMFQDHGAVGRIPTVQRVTWTDGWPVMGDGGVPEQDVRVNLPPSGRDYVWDSDEFSSGDLALVWQWNHKCDSSLWSLTERPGWLRLLAGRKPARDLSLARNTLTQRTVGPRCESVVLLDCSGLKPSSRAGICAFQSRRASIGVEVDSDGNRHIVARESHMVAGEKDDDAFRVENKVAEVDLEENLVWLRIRYVFTPADPGDAGDIAILEYSMDGEKWEPALCRLPMEYTLDYFTGYRSALFCYATAPEGAGAAADFDFFRQRVY